MKPNKLLPRLVNLMLFNLLLTFFLAQLMASHGPEGGGGVMALDPGDTNIVYRAGNGMHKSTDGGESWQRIEGPINFGFIDIRINPINPNVTYVWGVINEIWGIYKSMDGGINWRLVLRDGAWFDMDPSNPDTLYAVKYPEGRIIEGIFKSTDGGETWAMSLENRAVAFVAIHRVETSTIYVGGNALRKSTDGGVSWGVVGLEGMGAVPIFLDPVDVNTLYVGAAGIGPWGTYKSTDGGKTWRQLIDLLPLSMAIDPTDTQVIYMLTQPMVGMEERQGVYKSMDGGETWNRVNEIRLLSNVVIDPNNTKTVYVAAYAGTAKSIDAGESWTIHRRGFVATGIFIVIVATSEQNRIYANGWRSMDAGDSWSELGPGANVRVVDPVNPDTLYGVGQGALKKSTDAGDSWVTILSESILDTFAIDPNDANTLYAAGRCNPTPCDIFKSTDAGMNWTRVASLPQVFFFAVDPQDGQIIYAGTRSGVYKSTDGGEHWNPSGLGGLYVGWITIDENNPTTLYAGAGGGIYKSEDGAGSWSRLSDLNVNPVVIDPRDSNILYAGNTSGVFKSIDGGKTWEPRNQGLTNTSINHLAIARDTGRIYAATGGAGVWFSDDQAETWE